MRIFEFKSLVFALSLAILGGCGPDLPAGWEDAEPVVSLVQSECEGSPLEAFDERVSADLEGSPLRVEAFETHFRCAQDVEAFFRTSGSEIDVLVQPVDMNPANLAACDCLYDLEIAVTSPSSAPARVEVFRRWDSESGDSDPVSIGVIE